MRVLNMSVPIRPVASIVGFAQRVADSQEAGRAWCQVWLPVIRARAGLTQNQLADLLGVHRHTYRAVELGESVPSRDTAAKILDWLCSLESDQP